MVFLRGATMDTSFSDLRSHFWVYKAEFWQYSFIDGKSRIKRTTKEQVIMIVQQINREKIDPEGGRVGR